MRKAKLLALALAAVLLLAVPASASGYDLKAMSWQELLDLKAAITLELLSRDEWQEVEVPEGVYTVGEDIPAGKWTIRCKTGRFSRIEWGEFLDESGQGISFSGVIASDSVYNPSSRSYKEDERTEYTIEVKNGYHIVIEYGPATFQPYTGAPDLGFKKAGAAPAVEPSKPAQPTGSAASANKTLTAKEIKDRAEALGWSTTAWQEWYYVASQTGTTMEAIEEAAKNINRQLAEEDPDFLAALEEIGITEAQAKTMTPEKLFDAVITGLQNYNS